MARLGRPEALAAPRPLHQRRASLEVDVLPLEPAHLTGSHPGLSPQPEHRGGIGTDGCPGPVQEYPQLRPLKGSTWSMRGVRRNSTSFIGLAGISFSFTARWRISRRARSPVLSEASDSAFPGRRTDPPGARFASMKSSITSGVIAVMGRAPKKGRRCISVNER
jgi:hypothetical protein